MKNKLKEIRSARGMTQREAAAGLDINLPTYKTYEQGTRRLSDENLARLSAFFNCATDEILGLPRPLDKTTAGEGLQAKASQRFVAEAMKGMTPAERSGFQRLVNSYLRLSREGQDRLAEQAEMMVRSGMYARFGAPMAFSDGDPGLRAEMA